MNFGGSWRRRAKDRQHRTAWGKRRAADAAERRKVKNNLTGRAAETGRHHDGPHEWGPIKTGGGIMGIVQYRPCTAAGMSWTGRAICPFEQYRPIPKPGLGGRADVHPWRERRRGSW